MSRDIGSILAGQFAVMENNGLVVDTIFVNSQQYDYILEFGGSVLENRADGSHYLWKAKLL